MNKFMQQATPIDYEMCRGKLEYIWNVMYIEDQPLLYWIIIHMHIHSSKKIKLEFYLQ